MLTYKPLYTMAKRCYYEIVRVFDTNLKGIPQNCEIKIVWSWAFKCSVKR